MQTLGYQSRFSGEMRLEVAGPIARVAWSRRISKSVAFVDHRNCAHVVCGAQGGRSEARVLAASPEESKSSPTDDYNENQSIEPTRLITTVPSQWTTPRKPLY